MLFLYVNGNRVHDKNGDGSHAPLSFRTQAEGEAAADAMHAEQAALAQKRGRPAPLRSSFVIAAEPPPVD